MIHAREKFLSFEGYPSDAYKLVEHLRNIHDQSSSDMPKVLNDFVFNIEVQLQNIGFLDEHFNVRKNHA